MWFGWTVHRPKPIFLVDGDHFVVFIDNVCWTVHVVFVEKLCFIVHDGVCEQYDVHCSELFSPPRSHDVSPLFNRHESALGFYQQFRGQSKHYTTLSGGIPDGYNSDSTAQTRTTTATIKRGLNQLILPEPTSYSEDISWRWVDAQIYGKSQGNIVWTQLNKWFLDTFNAQKWYPNHNNGDKMARNAMYSLRLYELLQMIFESFPTPQTVLKIDVLFVWLCQTNEPARTLMMFRANGLDHVVAMLYGILSGFRGPEDYLVQILHADCLRHNLPTLPIKELLAKADMSAALTREFKTLREPMLLKSTASILNVFGGQKIPGPWKEYVSQSPLSPVVHQSTDVGRTLDNLGSYWIAFKSTVKRERHYMEGVIRPFHPDTGGKKGAPYYGRICHHPVNLPIVVISAFMFHPDFVLQRPWIFVHAALRRRIIKAIEYLMIDREEKRRKKEDLGPMRYIVEFMPLSTAQIETHLLEERTKDDADPLLKSLTEKPLWHLAAEIFHWIQVCTAYLSIYALSISLNSLGLKLFFFV